MNMIARILKHGQFYFNEEDRIFVGKADKWNKTYLFAYLRFVVSMTQKFDIRKVVKKHGGI